MDRPAKLSFSYIADRVARRLRYRGSYQSNAKAFVIGGCARSGTTLIRVILDTHSQICCGPEGDFFMRPLMPGDREEIEEYARRFDFTVPEVEELISNTKSHAEFIDRFSAIYAERNQKEFWAAKGPRFIYRIDYIFKHFPNARFIHMIRDGRDVVCSLQTHPRYRIVDGERVKTNIRRPIEECVERWIKDTRVGMAYRNDPRYCEVRYEDIVNDSEPVLRKLFAFLEVDWEDDVLRFHEVETASRDASKFPQNPEATKPVYHSAIGRWKTDLSKDEIDYVLKHAGPLLQELQYTVD